VTHFRGLPAILSCCLAVAATGPIHAGPVHFPDGSAISGMTEEDVRMLRQAALVALEDTDDGIMVHWENPKTGAAGVLTPLSTSQRDGKLCRQLELFSDAGGERGRSVFSFCRQPDSSWRVTSSSPRAG